MIILLQAIITELSTPIAIIGLCIVYKSSLLYDNIITSYYYRMI